MTEVVTARTWEVVEAAAETDLAVIRDGVTSVGRALAIGGQPRPIACLVREADQVVAGGTGRTEFSRLFVNYLWVTEPLRSRGLGQQVSAMLESAARERGCVDALIETLDDHVASLYVRWGYTAVATIPTYVGRFTKHVLVKPLPSVERCS